MTTMSILDSFVQPCHFRITFTSLATELRSMVFATSRSEEGYTLRNYIELYSNDLHLPDDFNENDFSITRNGVDVGFDSLPENGAEYMLWRERGGEMPETSGVFLKESNPYKEAIEELKNFYGINDTAMLVETIKRDKLKNMRDGYQRRSLERNYSGFGG